MVPSFELGARHGRRSCGRAKVPVERARRALSDAPIPKARSGRAAVVGAACALLCGSCTVGYRHRRVETGGTLPAAVARRVCRKSPIGRVLLRDGDACAVMDAVARLFARNGLTVSQSCGPWETNGPGRFACTSGSPGQPGRRARSDNLRRVGTGAGFSNRVVTVRTPL